jgi:hypothetical protein
MPRAEPKRYQQRRPEKTVLYRVIQQHLERTASPSPRGRDGAITGPSDVSGARSLCETQRTSSNPQAPSAAALPRAEAAPLAPSQEASEEIGGRMRFVERVLAPPRCESVIAFIVTWIPKSKEGRGSSRAEPLDTRRSILTMESDVRHRAHLLPFRLAALRVRCVSATGPP